jgi:hypothetical protein
MYDPDWLNAYTQEPLDIMERPCPERFLSSMLRHMQDGSHVPLRALDKRSIEDRYSSRYMYGMKIFERSLFQKFIVKWFIYCCASYSKSITLFTL